MESPGIRDALVPVSGATRRTIAVVDATTGDTTQLNEPGPLVAPTEWSAFTEAYEELLTSASAVALCGSLPPGVPVGAYAQLVRAARAASVPVLLDSSGEPLRRGLAARPDIIKPNSDELAELTGSHEPLRATRDARRRGAHSVVASLGPEGLLAVTPDGSWRAPAPDRVKGNPTGSRRLGGQPACSRAAWRTCRGRTAWPARWPCPRRRCWPRWPGSSTARPTRNCSAGSR